MPSQPPPPVLHMLPTAVEQAHIKEALEASQTAMGAIQSLLSLSQWVLGILGLVLAGIAIFGWVAIRNAVLSQSKQIANKRMDDYIGTDGFKALVAERIAKSVDERWSNTVVVSRLAEETRPPGDLSPFPKAGESK